MHEGNLQRLIFLFKGAFDSLGVVVPLVKIEDLSVLIYKGMTVQARNYHNLDHVFSLTDAQSPIITLSALFHDLVYCQVDQVSSLKFGKSSIHIFLNWKGRSRSRMNLNRMNFIS